MRSDYEVLEQLCKEAKLGLINKDFEYDKGTLEAKIKSLLPKLSNTDFFFNNYDHYLIYKIDQTFTIYAKIHSHDALQIPAIMNNVCEIVRLYEKRKKYQNQ